MALPDMQSDTDHVITTYPRDAREADPDSDGEDIPDPEIIPEFDDAKLVLVRVAFKRLFNAYKRAMALGLYNCVGKEFLDAVGEYVDLCTRNVTASSQFLYLHNTSPGEPQPGGTYIKWSVPTRELRSTSSAAVTRNIKTNERYADVTYDKITFINVMVSEVKESENSAIEAQNNEQMLGLWKGSQQAMLGLEVYGHCVRPKVLSLNGV